MESNRGVTRVGNMTVVEKDDVITGIVKNNSLPRPSLSPAKRDLPGIIVNPQTVARAPPVDDQLCRSVDPSPRDLARGDMACGRPATKVKMPEDF